jgi:hypothetical protein
MYTAVTISLSFSSASTPPPTDSDIPRKDIKRENCPKTMKTFVTFITSANDRRHFFLSWSMHFVLFFFILVLFYDRTPGSVIILLYTIAAIFSAVWAASPRVFFLFFLRPIVSAKGCPATGLLEGVVWQKRKTPGDRLAAMVLQMMFCECCCSDVLRDQPPGRKGYDARTMRKRSFRNDSGETILRYCSRAAPRESKVGQRIIILVFITTSELSQTTLKQ